MAVVAVDTVSGSGSVLIELTEAPNADLSDVYGAEATRDVRQKVVKLARPLFAEAVDLVCACANEVKHRFDQMPQGTRPQEFEMQFAVRLDAKIGASIVETTGGAQLQVNLRWRDPDGR